MNQVKKNIFISISWISLASIIVLFSIQTHSLNQNMALFLVILPTLLNMPLIFKSRNKTTTNFQFFMLGINIAIFLLAVGTAILEPTYISYVRWGMGVASIIGLLINVYLIKCSVGKKTF